MIAAQGWRLEPNSVSTTKPYNAVLKCGPVQLMAPPAAEVSCREFRKFRKLR
jgi:hypothetical protein